MKVLIIGASGKTGKILVEKALEKKYSVKIYVRDISRVQQLSNIDIIQGQLNEIEKLSTAMDGVDVVLVALGNKITHMSSPLFVYAIPNIVKAMKKSGVKRIINLSALGSGVSYKNAGFPCNVFAKTFLKANFEDHANGEGSLYLSDLEWTNIHPALLYTGSNVTDAVRIFNTSANEKVWGLSMTSRQDVAKLMIDSVDDKASYKQSLILVSKRIF